MNPMSGCDIRLVFTLQPRDSTLQYKRCVHLWNKFPYIITLWEAIKIYFRQKPKLNLEILTFLEFQVVFTVSSFVVNVVNALLEPVSIQFRSAINAKLGHNLVIYQCQPGVRTRPCNRSTPNQWAWSIINVSPWTQALDRSKPNQCARPLTHSLRTRTQLLSCSNQYRVINWVYF